MARRGYRDAVAVITGASSGIGAAFAHALAGHGARLVLAARRQDRLNAQLSSLPLTCPGAIAVQTDVTDERACAELVRQAVERFGRIDLLVLNAGISTNAPVQALELSVARRVMDVNYFGALNPFLQALPQLIASRGQVIVISSLAGKKGMSTRAAYCGSKFALHGFFDGARADLRKDGVSITLACPGYVESEVRLHALKGDGSAQGRDDQGGRAMQSAEDCVQEILRAAAREQRELIMGGMGARLLTVLEPLLPELTEWLAEKASGRSER